MAKQPSVWQSKIVGFGEEDVDQILANPLNFRLHSAEQQTVMQDLLKEVGVVQTIIINRTTNRLIDGHMRVLLAMKDGQKTLPVTYVELTEAEENKILALFDEIGAMAGRDRALAAELAKMVQTQSDAIAGVLKGYEAPIPLPPEAAAVPASEGSAGVCPTCGQAMK